MRFCPILKCNNKCGSVQFGELGHRAPNESGRTLNLDQQSGKRQPETPCDDFQVNDGDVSFSSLRVCQITPIQPELLCHLDLCPASLLSELSQSPPEPNADVLGHKMPSWLGDSPQQSGYEQHQVRGCSAGRLPGCGL